ncbi:MAG: hypothetical protein HOD27_06575 [Betaproteobacteria bacterium]|nr:hypothetical protein [Betaproteobacteria bacterium]
MGVGPESWSSLLRLALTLAITNLSCSADVLSVFDAGRLLQRIVLSWQV